MVDNVASKLILLSIENIILLYREQLMGHINEQEKLGRTLREEQKAVKDLVQNSEKQLAMWQDVIQ